MFHITKDSDGFNASKSSGDNLQPPVVGNRLASRKGAGQAPWPNTVEEFDILRIVMYGYRRKYLHEKKSAEPQGLMGNAYPNFDAAAEFYAKCRCLVELSRVG
jgi:hypothetical protein